MTRLALCVYITRPFFCSPIHKSRNGSIKALDMDLAIGVVIFLFDKSGFGHHTNFYPLGSGNITCAIDWTERKAQYSFSFTAEVKHTRTATAVPECRNTILLKTQTTLCFCRYLCLIVLAYIAVIPNAV